MNASKCDHFLRKQDAYDFIDGYLDKQNKMGTAYYWIPGGGHTSIAPLGYIDAGKEYSINNTLYILIYYSIFLITGNHVNLFTVYVICISTQCHLF